MKSRDGYFWSKICEKGENLTFSGALLVDDSPQKFSLSPAPLLDFAEISDCFRENVNIVFVLSKNTIPHHALSGENFYVAGDFNGRCLIALTKLKCEIIWKHSHLMSQVAYLKNMFVKSLNFLSLCVNGECCGCGVVG
jgi:hypothetical protein